MVKGVIVESIESDIPEDLVQIFKVLGDKTRLRIIKLLMQNVCTTQELAQKLEISEAAVSKHLQRFRKYGCSVAFAYSFCFIQKQSNSTTY